MKKLSLLLAVLVCASPALAAVRIIVAPEGSTAAVKYETDGEKVRAFALDITVNQGTIDGITDFIRGESTAQNPGYGIFPGNFGRYITVDPDTGEVASWTPAEYTPVADPCDPGALGGLGTSGITIEMGALYFPTDDASPNAPPNSGTLFKLTLSEPASVSVTLNEARGGVVLTNPDVAATVNLEQATNVAIGGGGIAIASVGLLAPSHPDYAEWVAVGKPACWAYPRQSRGDADGLKDGGATTGYSYVGASDLRILSAAWLKPSADVIGTIGICADFAHDEGHDATIGSYRVGLTDLNILLQYWMKPDAEIPSDRAGKLVP